jgi:hypothetical protein
VTLDVFKALHGHFVHDLDEGLWKLAGSTEALLRDVQAAFARLNKSVFVRSLDALHLVTARADASSASTRTIGTRIRSFLDNPS